jgi:hypothetical protein
MEANVIVENLDVDLDHEKIETKIEAENGKIYISPNGYGDASSEDGHGCPIIIEHWNNELRVVVWADINQEDPTHIISLENAKEINRN